MRPNVIILNPDQWRGDHLGHVGHPAARTPVLDRIAREDGVSFSRAFVQNPVCTPSRCSFMTGWYPHVRGHRTMFHMLRPDEPCLLKVMKDAGWHVWWGGKNDLVPGQTSWEPYAHERVTGAGLGAGPRGNFHGRDDWRGDPDGDQWYSFHVGRGHIDPATGDMNDGDWVVLRELVKAIDRFPRDRPFCAFWAAMFPHPPYAVEDPWFSAIDRSAIPSRSAAGDPAVKPSLLRGIRERQRLTGWSEERWRELRATYLGMCMRVDHQIGLVLQALRATGRYDDTAVLVFSDHGDFTGDYGLVEKTQNTFEDCLTRVPLLIKPPASRAARPGVRDALVELVDVPATIYDLCGIEPGYDHFGRSLMPLVDGSAATHRDAVFCEGGRLEPETQAMELQSSSHQDPRGLYWPRVGLQQRWPEHAKATMCRSSRFKYVHRLAESHEFYDLARDPGESDNRIQDPALAGEISRHRDLLLDWFQRTADVVPRATDSR